jgi:hypothetical protein
VQFLLGLAAGIALRFRAAHPVQALTGRADNRSNTSRRGVLLMKSETPVALITFALAINLLLAPTPAASAENVSKPYGQRLLDSCRSLAVQQAADSGAGAACVNYIAGVTQTLNAIGPRAQRIALGPSSSGICIPPEISLGDMAGVFVRAADEHPEMYAQSTEMPTLFMAVVFADRWPCDAER